MLATREGRRQLPSLLARFRAEGANADSVVIGAHRRPEGVVPSYERYLQLFAGRERVRTILEDRAATGTAMGDDEARRLRCLSSRRPVVVDVSVTAFFVALDRYVAQTRRTKIAAERE